MPGTCQPPNEPGASPAASRGDLGPRTTPTSTLPTSVPYQPNPYAPTGRAPSELPPARRTRAPIPTAAATTALLDATTALLAAAKQNSDVAATALATAYTALKNEGLGRHSRPKDFLLWHKENAAQPEQESLASADRASLTSADRAALVESWLADERATHAALAEAVDTATDTYATAMVAVGEATTNLFNTRIALHAAHNESYALRCEREAVSRAAKSTRGADSATRTQGQRVTARRRQAFKQDPKAALTRRLAGVRKAMTRLHRHGGVGPTSEKRLASWARQLRARLSDLSATASGGGGPSVPSRSSNDDDGSGGGEQGVRVPGAVISGDIVESMHEPVVLLFVRLLGGREEIRVRLPLTASVASLYAEV